MGSEVRCRVSVEGRAFDAKALLETDELIVRGERRVVLKLREITRARVDGGSLILVSKSGTLRVEVGLELGPAVAARWLAKITTPPSRLDKLGIGPETRVARSGRALELPELGDRVSARVAESTDVVLHGAEAIADLARLARLRRAIRPDAAVWVVYPKGRNDIREADVLAAGRAAGFKDVKVARFSETHTALKFVVPIAHRE